MSDTAQIVGVAVMLIWILIATLFTKTDSDRQRLFLVCALIMGAMLF